MQWRFHNEKNWECMKLDLKLLLLENAAEQGDGCHRGEAMELLFEYSQGVGLLSAYHAVQFIWNYCRCYLEVDSNQGDTASATNGAVRRVAQYSNLIHCQMTDPIGECYALSVFLFRKDAAAVWVPFLKMIGLSQQNHGDAVLASSRVVVFQLLYSEGLKDHFHSIIGPSTTEKVGCDIFEMVIRDTSLHQLVSDGSAIQTPLLLSLPFVYHATGHWDHIKAFMSDHHMKHIRFLEQLMTVSHKVGELLADAYEELHFAWEPVDLLFLENVMVLTWEPVMIRGKDVRSNEAEQWLLLCSSVGCTQTLMGLIIHNGACLSVWSYEQPELSVGKEVQHSVLVHVSSRVVMFPSTEKHLVILLNDAGYWSSWLFAICLNIDGETTCFLHASKQPVFKQDGEVQVQEFKSGQYMCYLKLIDGVRRDGMLTPNFTDTQVPWDPSGLEFVVDILTNDNGLGTSRVSRREGCHEPVMLQTGPAGVDWIKAWAGVWALRVSPEKQAMDAVQRGSSHVGGGFCRLTTN